MSSINKNEKAKHNTLMIVTLGLLIALNIVLSRFVSINAWNIKIGFTFASTFAAAYLFGPIPGLIVGALGDFLGAILFPIGAYFPGFTFDCLMTGLIMGLILHKKQNHFRIGLVVFLDQFIISLLLATLWIKILYGTDYGTLLATRIVQVLIMSVVEYVGILLLIKILDRVKESVINNIK